RHEEFYSVPSWPLLVKRSVKKLIRRSVRIKLTARDPIDQDIEFPFTEDIPLEVGHEALGHELAQAVFASLSPASRLLAGGMVAKRPDRRDDLGYAESGS